MTNYLDHVRKATNLFKYTPKLSCSKSNRSSNKFSSALVHSIFNTNPFWVQLSYFVILSLVGFVALTNIEFKTSSFKPKAIDIFFTAVSAATVSSMSTVDMEVFSNTQLIVLMFLMFMGGEVFVSMLGLQFRKLKHRMIKFGSDSINDSTFDSDGCSIESGVVSNDLKHSPNISFDQNHLMEAIRSLGYVVMCFILLVHFFGYIFAYIYITFTPSSKNILINKGINRHIFSLFLIVSTFANCGFVPTNENMIIFKKNSGFLLILIPQILLGSTLFPVVLRAVILVLKKIMKRAEFGYMLKYTKELDYDQLLPTVQSFYLAMTVFGFILVQFVVFCCIEWHNTEALGGLNGYEKAVSCFFQVVSTRYAGEAVFDLSKISPAILVGFVVMMYLPPSTMFLPIQGNEIVSGHDDKMSKQKDERNSFVEYLLFSRLSYLVMFTIFICLLERRNMDVDPLNFNVLSIVFEVISAYGNVGSSLGYSCERQINPTGHCKDEWYGFAGKWSNNGKYLLIFVMFFGRLKNFNKNGGRFWKV